MKQQLAQLVEQAIATLKADGALPADLELDVQIERGRGEGHGDFATNTAMRLAKPAKRPPREIAQALVEALPAHEHVERVEIAGPGFINFFLTADAAFDVVRRIHREAEIFGRGHVGAGRRILVEFVSANPTGPLHVGHGRGAAFGSALANLLATAGFDVHREYYVNDAGRQMDILAVSVLLRYLEVCGESPRFPDNGYRGDYIRDIAADLHRRDGDAYRVDTAALMADLPPDAADGGDKEQHVDALVVRARELLGETRYRAVHQAALDAILADIRDDLAEFSVTFDRWFSERSLTDDGAVARTIERLQEAGHLYEENGALWFRATAFGDDKDRVVRRADGLTTYFASDIAYHLDKFERGFDQLIDVFGADHHGYMARVRASLEAFGYPADRLEFRLVQFAILYRGSERLSMSTRSGEFVTLRELRDEVGRDAARFFYVMRKPEQHLDFDLELAKSESSDNPVYYVQYAHARICSVLGQLADKGLDHEVEAGFATLAKLTEDHEQALITQLDRFPEMVESAALAHEPHQIAHYLRELANAFHTYYNAHQFLVDDDGLRNARLNLILATRQVLRNGLAILGVSAPESM
ncbi:arginine--tRNA ligase [Arhodomonas sp. AD133]|uniref:arginine--tRNA ligase n=1 Tax=Arhodomonas sp. AD133 TaxID=3415009 RepID=UPI003EB80AFA